MIGSLTRTTLSVFIAMTLSVMASPQLSEPEPAQGSEWEIVTVDSDGEGGVSERYWFTSLALDSNDNPHISYHDKAKMDLKYARSNGTAWNIETVDSSTSVGNYLSLALDSNDNAHISYSDSLNHDLKYAKWDGSVWSSEVVDSDGEVGASNSIALDRNDNAHISYFDSFNQTLKYAKWDGSAWNIEIVDNSSIVGDDPSLALDSNDNAHISYFDGGNQDLKYAKWDGSIWKIETVDSNGRVGEYSSLVLDSGDYPHISYFDTTEGNAKYAKWTGFVWRIEMIDSPHHDGKWTSLALDSSERPHISYFDEFDDDIVYAEWNGIEWDIETVDSDGMTGYFTSMALDSCDDAHISYYLRAVGDVKYATKAKRCPRPPEMLGADLSGNDFENVTLTWSLSPDDGMGSKSVVGYEIYRNMTYDPDGLGYGLVASIANGTSDFTDVTAGEGDPNNYFYLVCAISSASNTSCAKNQAGKFTRPLSKDPNLLSIPLIQSDESIEKVLQTVKWDKAWCYYAWDTVDPWKWYMAFKSYKGDLKTIDYKVGVWVNVTEESNLTVAGIVPLHTSFQLHVGWNLVGFPSFDSNYAVGEMKAEISVMRVEGFDPSAPPYFLKVLTDGDILQTGFGYWIRMESETIWVVSNS
ncbi:MAG: hypothetical protein KAW09_04695 [Thermoplasmata archaeon]|nr:hypothetical protein [Thermoplasmata archaeon]